MTSAAPRAPLRAPTRASRTPWTSSARRSRVVGRTAFAAAPVSDEPFSARFVAELTGRPARLLVALLATAIGAALLAGNATARATAGADAPGATDPLVTAAESSGTPHGRDHVDDWAANARAAAATCPGLPADVLVAIGQVETRLGRELGPSSAGALGPMQFLPGTWSAYGTDGDGDGAADIMNPLDSLHAAARLLCANGGAEPGRLRSALWNYNHSPEYVERVVRVAGMTA